MQIDTQKKAQLQSDLALQTTKTSVIRWIPPVVISVMFFIVCYLTPWVGDNITYGYSWATGRPITSVMDAFISQCTHYIYANGRFVNHMLCQTLIPFTNPAVFAAMSALMALALVYIVSRLGAGRKFGFGTALTVSLLLWLAKPYSEPVYQIGYIWMAVLTFVFAGIYLYWAPRYQAKGPGVKSVAILGLLFVFGLISGNAHDGICPAICGAVVLRALYRRRSYTAAEWVMTIGYVIGTLILCLSPGILHRASSTGIPILFTIMGVFTEYVIFLILLVALVVYRLLGRVDLRKFYIDNAFWCNALILLTGFHLIIGIGAATQLFGQEMVSLILLIRLLRGHAFGPKLQILAAVAVVGMTVGDISTATAQRREYDMLLPVMSRVETDTVLYIDLPAGNYGLWMPYILSTYRTLQIDSIAKVDDPHVRLYPGRFAEIADRDTNAVIEYRPGVYMAIRSKSKPATFVLHRKIAAMSVGLLPMSDNELIFNDPGNSTDICDIIFVNRVSPYIINTGIDIITDDAIDTDVDKE